MKKILMLLALAGVTSVAMAQQGASSSGYEETLVPNKYKVITNTFWNNWFISVGGGASVLFGDDDTAGSFGDRISPTLNVAVGKWFTPGMGLRLQYSGLQAKGFTYDVNSSYIIGGQQPGGYYKQKFDYMNLHGDVLFNLSALIGGYNSERVYEVIPYLGAGFTHNYTSPHRQSMSLNAGIINRFRLGSGVDLNIELSAVGVEDKFDSQFGGHPGYDALASVTAGITYKFPTRGFKRPAPQLLTELELHEMRVGIAELAAANAGLAEEVARKQAQLDVARVEEALVADTEAVDTDIAPRTVFFQIGSSELSPREVMNLSYLAERMKEYPETSYTVYGYADSATGSATLNQKLSQSRAQAVVNLLVKKFGVNAKQLKINAGGGVDKFGKPDYLNRVVLVESVE